MVAMAQAVINQQASHRDTLVHIPEHDFGRQIIPSVQERTPSIFTPRSRMTIVTYLLLLFQV